MTKSADGVWRVERALRAKVGDRATELLRRKTKHLADLSPHEVAQAPNGDRIVLAELDNIVLQASGASLGVRHRFGCTGSIRGPRRRGRLTNV